MRLLPNNFRSSQELLDPNEDWVSHQLVFVTVIVVGDLLSNVHSTLKFGNQGVKRV